MKGYAALCPAPYVTFQNTGEFWRRYEWKVNCTLNAATELKRQTRTISFADNRNTFPPPPKTRQPVRYRLLIITKHSAHDTRT